VLYEDLAFRERCVGKGESYVCCRCEARQAASTPSYVGRLGAPARWVNESKRFSGA
jgi:hypothetical protein